MGGLGQKIFRAREAFHVITRRAADRQTRVALIDIYRNLGDRSRYDEPVNLRLRIGNSVLPCRMRLSDIFILGEILFEGQYRIQSPVTSGGVIIDAGGNVGLSALWFLGQLEPGQLHVFEPAKENFNFLSANLAADPRVRLNRAAVGAEAGTLTLFHEEFAGMHSLKQSPDSGGGETVPVVTLGEYLDQNGIEQVDLLKLDIEGSELDALFGLGDRLAVVRVIVGEVHETLMDTRAFYDHLDRFGFRIVWKKWFREGAASGVHNFEAVRQE